MCNSILVNILCKGLMWEEKQDSTKTGIKNSRSTWLAVTVQLGRFSLPIKIRLAPKIVSVHGKTSWFTAVLFPGSLELDLYSETKSDFQQLLTSTLLPWSVHIYLVLNSIKSISQHHTYSWAQSSLKSLICPEWSRKTSSPTLLNLLQITEPISHFTSNQCFIPLQD